VHGDHSKDKKPVASLGWISEKQTKDESIQGVSPLIVVVFSSV
jgi:hypothetical protein